MSRSALVSILCATTQLLWACGGGDGNSAAAPVASSPGTPPTPAPTPPAPAPTPPAPAPTPPAEIAGLHGKLAFLRNDPAKDNANPKDGKTGTLFLYDFATKTLTNLSDLWKGIIYYVKNPAFSPDGKMLTFAAFSDENASEEDIFIWNLDPSATTCHAIPCNLTPGTHQKSEDPKFSPDGTSIVFKMNGELMLLSHIGTPSQAVLPLTNDQNAPEHSQPDFMPDGMRIIYSSMLTPSDDSTQVLQTLSLLPGGGITAQQTLADGKGLEEFYPIHWTSDEFLFVRWQAPQTSQTPPDKRTRIYSYSFSTAATAPLPFNQPACNNSDPFPADNTNTLVFYVNDCAGGAGGTDIYIGSTATGKSYALSIFDSSLATSDDELGPAYFPGP